MLRVIVVVVATVSITACSEDNNDPPPLTGYRISGAVEKGPFVLGSSVSLSPVNNTGQPTGQTFNTQTSDDAGRFSVEIDTNGPMSIEGSGFYYNEVLGRLSSAQIVLRAFAEVSDAAHQTIYLNTITHMTYNRVQHLVSGGESFIAALAQAEGELFAALGVGGAGYHPGKAANQMSLLGGDHEANAYLFVVSAILAQAALTASPQSVDATLQELMNTIAADLADDGEIAASIETQLADAEEAIDPGQILVDLAARAEAVGSSAPLPDPHQVLDSDGDGLINDEDNCPFVANPGQEDADANEVGDVCECGNGSLDWGEQCDDGNAIDTDECTNSCQLGFCADLGGPVLCEDSFQCPTDHTCRREVDTATGCCVSGAGCGAGAECNPGSVCIDGECARLCMTFADCEPGEVCTAGVCGGTSGCDSNDECEPGSVCIEGACRRLCSIDADCLLGEACTNDVCLADVDGDGVPDSSDNCPDVANRPQSDIDMDGTGDACDSDGDGDMVDDVSDICPVDPNAAQVDTDSDGTGDVCDDDDDNDGIPDASDPCRLGVDTACEDDADGDGIEGGVDNCPGVYNPEVDHSGNQLDTDADGIGDLCDLDLDGDGVDNWADNCMSVANPGQEDTDGDGLGDACDPT